MNGETLKARRAALRLSQESLAYELGVSVMTISRWERGLHRIPKAIGKALVAMELKGN